MKALALTDAGSRISDITSGDGDGIISYENIATYHYDVFFDIGQLPKAAWAGSFFEEFVGSGTWMLGYDPNIQITDEMWRQATNHVINNTEAANGLKATDTFFDFLNADIASGNMAAAAANDPTGFASSAMEAMAEFFGDLLNGAVQGAADNGIFFPQLGLAAALASAAFDAALNIATPLVIDLDNDGFHFTDIANGSDAFFDLKGNQFAVNTSWNETGDGFLARDANSNGRIDNITELFGANGGTTAWQKLAALDTNTDNVINASDSGWSTLRIWKDANGNGLTDTDELKTLADHSITAISLQQNSNAFLATRV